MHRTPRPYRRRSRPSSPLFRPSLRMFIRHVFKASHRPFLPIYYIPYYRVPTLHLHMYHQRSTWPHSYGQLSNGHFRHRFPRRRSPIHQVLFRPMGPNGNASRRCHRGYGGEGYDVLVPSACDFHLLPSSPFHPMRPSTDRSHHRPHQPARSNERSGRSDSNTCPARVVRPLLGPRHHPRTGQRRSHWMPTMEPQVGREAHRPRGQVIKVNVTVRLLRSPSNFSRSNRRRRGWRGRLRTEDLYGGVTRRGPRRSRLPTRGRFFKFKVRLPIMYHRHSPNGRRRRSIQRYGQSTFPPTEPYHRGHPSHRRHRQRIRPRSFPHRGTIHRYTITSRQHNSRRHPRGKYRYDPSSVPVRFRFRTNMFCFRTCPFFVQFSS